jgi:hypothetical protein
MEPRAKLALNPLAQELLLPMEGPKVDPRPEESRVSKQIKNVSAKVALLLLTPVIAFASATPNTSSTTTAQAPATAKAAKAWISAVSISRSNSLYDQKNGTEQASWDLSASTRYKWNKDWSSAVLLEGSQDLMDETASDWSRLQLSTRRAGIPLGSSWKSMVNANLGLPISRVQKAATLKASVGLSGRADLNSKSAFDDRFSFAGLLSFTRNIHDFETAKSGSVNTQYSSVQGIETGWSFTEKTSISLSLSHINTWTYQGTMKEYYSHSQELGYQASPMVGLALGHQYGAPFASVWSTRGDSYNFQIIDEDNSYVYGSMTLSF